MKLYTEVNCEKLSPLSRGEKICVLGSCFADAIGEKLAAAGFDVLRNPFGTLYNPASVATAVERLDSARPFTADECVEMGAGAGLVCSFAHHTRFARPTPEAFLDAANAALAADAAAWAGCRRVIVTLGTAWVWRALERPGRPVVANCLKRPAREFAHELLGVDACAALLRSLVEDHPDKQFLFTVSPIRHLGDGAHANTLSKSTLQLAVQQVVTAFSNPSSSPAAVPSSCLAPTGSDISRPTRSSWTNSAIIASSPTTSSIPPIPPSSSSGSVFWTPAPIPPTVRPSLPPNAPPAPPATVPCGNHPAFPGSGSSPREGVATLGSSEGGARRIRVIAKR